MFELRKVNVCLLLVLSFVLFLNSSGVVGQEETSQCERPRGPTVTKNVQDIEDWIKLKWDPNNPQTVNRGESVEIKVFNGKPDFTWQVSGENFWLDENYSITSITTSARSIGLYAGPGACGTAIITVTDSCDPPDEVTGSAREPNNRNWMLVYDNQCGSVTLEPGQCNCTNCSTVVVGGYKYQDCWCGGTRTYRYDGPYCSKWPATEDLSDTKCSCPGFYYPFDVVGLLDHRMWEWRCY